MKTTEIDNEKGCNGLGMCPGIALLVSGFIGIALHAITRWDWSIALSIMTLTPALMAGLHKSLNPFRKKTTH